MSSRGKIKAKLITGVYSGAIVAAAKIGSAGEAQADHKESKQFVSTPHLVPCDNADPAAYYIKEAPTDRYIYM